MEQEIAKNIDGLKVEINMTEKAVFNYLLINSTKKFGKFIWGLAIIAAIILPYSIYQKDIRLFVISALIVYMTFVARPLQYRGNSKSQMLNNESFQKPIKYIFNDEGVYMIQAAGEGLIKWDEIFRIENRKHLLLIYMNEVQAFIIIKEQIKADELSQLKSIISGIAGLKHNIKE